MLESDKAKQKKLVQRKKGKPSDFNHFVYVVNKGSHSIGIYKIDNQGKLTLISTQKAIKKPVSIAAHPFRNFIYVLEFTRIITYKIRDNGTLEPIGTLKIGVGGKILKVHPNGKFVYATTSNPMINIGMYKVMGDGRLRGMGDVFTYKKPVDFDIEPGGRFAYFHDRKKANEILMYRIAIDGKLKTIGEQEVNKGKYSGQVVVDPAGIYLYVSSIPANAIFTYKIKPSGKLEQKNKTENAGIPGDMLFNEDGDLLYVTQLKQNKVTVYSVSKKGALLKKGEIKTGKSPEEMAIHQNGKYIYVTNKTSSEIFVYKTSGATLEKIQNIRCGVNPEAICIGRTRKQKSADKRE
jgi:6-phosphogluconolactonase (cycloisomerase 2 family)